MDMIEHISSTIKLLRNNKIGALIVFENNTNLIEFINTGIVVDANLSKELLSTIFWEGSPTHDGAVIVQNGKIASVGCLLPLSDTNINDRRYGMRHRAAIGVSELTDALVLVLSEETGQISVVYGANLITLDTLEDLQKYLSNWLKENYMK